MDIFFFMTFFFFLSRLFFLYSVVIWIIFIFLLYIIWKFFTFYTNILIYLFFAALNPCVLNYEFNDNHIKKNYYLFSWYRLFSVNAIGKWFKGFLALVQNCSVNLIGWFWDTPCCIEINIRHRQQWN